MTHLLTCLGSWFPLVLVGCFNVGDLLGKRPQRSNPSPNPNLNPNPDPIARTRTQPATPTRQEPTRARAPGGPARAAVVDAAAWRLRATLPLAAPAGAAAAAAAGDSHPGLRGRVPLEAQYKCKNQPARGFHLRLSTSASASTRAGAMLTMAIRATYYLLWQGDALPVLVVLSFGASTGYLGCTCILLRGKSRPSDRQTDSRQADRQTDRRQTDR